MIPDDNLDLQNKKTLKKRNAENNILVNIKYILFLVFKFFRKFLIV